MNNTIELAQYSWESLTSSSLVIYILAPMKSGKTLLNQSIIEKLNVKQGVFVTRQMDLTYKELEKKPSLKIALQDLMSMDKSISKIGVLDDIWFPSDSKCQELLSTMIINTRYYNTTLLVSMQYTHALPKRERSNGNIIFIGWFDDIQERKSLYKTYFGIFPTFEQFEHALKIATQEKGGFLVIDKTKQGLKIEEKVFVYRVPVSEN